MMFFIRLNAFLAVGLKKVQALEFWKALVIFRDINYKSFGFGDLGFLARFGWVWDLYFLSKSFVQIFYNQNNILL